MLELVDPLNRAGGAVVVFLECFTVGAVVLVCAREGGVSSAAPLLHALVAEVAGAFGAVVEEGEVGRVGSWLRGAAVFAVGSHVVCVYKVREKGGAWASTQLVFPSLCTMI